MFVNTINLILGTRKNQMVQGKKHVNHVSELGPIVF